jgi:hypothetical protein
LVRISDSSASDLARGVAARLLRFFWGAVVTAAANSNSICSAQETCLFSRHTSFCRLAGAVDSAACMVWDCLILLSNYYTKATKLTVQTGVFEIQDKIEKDGG